MLYARSRVVHAAARFSLDLIDVPCLNLKDTEGHAAEARQQSADASDNGIEADTNGDDRLALPMRAPRLAAPT